jgi:DUF1680 family protein
VAIERGPLVYALEQDDQEPGAVVDDVRIDVSAALGEEERRDLLGGTVVVTATGAAQARPGVATGSGPYRSAGMPAPSTGAPVTLRAIPYHLWANRGPQAMRVWIPVA